MKHGNTLHGFDQTPHGEEASREALRHALAALLQRVADGDEGAMEIVYRSTSAKLYGLLLRMLPDRGMADEVLQDTYLAVWRRADSFVSGEASPMSWLIAIARNKAIDRLRSERNRPRGAALGEAADPPDPAPSPLGRLEAGDTRRRLEWCIDQLEARQKAAIRTAFFSGVTYEDLARREGVALGTMKSWIRRGLLRLRACLEP